MSKLDRSIILYDKKQWQQYQKDILFSVIEANVGHHISLQVTIPESYPCLVYLLPAPTDILDPLNHEINCCYIYTNKPEELLEALKIGGTLDLATLESELKCYGYKGPQGDLGMEGEDDEEDEEVVFDDDNYQPEDSFESAFATLQEELWAKPVGAKDYVPASAGVLLLTLVSELRSIGALRLDRIMETAKDIEQWMVANQEENLQLNAMDLLKKLWDKQDAR